MQDTTPHWVSDAKSSVLDGNAVDPGKVVWLEEDLGEFHTPPTRFQVWLQLDSFLERVRRLARQAATFQAQVTMRAIRARPATSRSERPWSAGNGLHRTQSVYYFDCDAGHHSGTLSVSAAGWTVTGDRGGKVGVTYTHPVGGAIAAEASATVKQQTLYNRTSVDPTLRAELLTPWGQDALDLYPHAANELATVGLRPDIGLVDDYAEGFFPREAPPGWQLSVEPTPWSIEPGEEQPIAVSILTPTPGRGAYAVKVSDVDHPERFVVSDIYELEIVPEGHPSLFQQKVRELKLRLDQNKTPDPDVDLLVAVYDEDVAAARDALDRGGDPNVHEGEVLRRHDDES